GGADARNGLGHDHGTGAAGGMRDGEGQAHLYDTARLDRLGGDDGSHSGRVACEARPASEWRACGRDGDAGRQRAGDLDPQGEVGARLLRRGSERLYWPGFAFARIDHAELQGRADVWL